MSSNGSDIDKVYQDFIDSLKTKIAKYQAKRSLERNINFNSKGLQVKDLIIHLLYQRGHHLFFIKNKSTNKTEFYIGTVKVRVFELNKTTALFAKYLINRGYCFKGNKVLDYNKMINSKNLRNEDNWVNHVCQIDLTDVLLSEDNFGSFSNLVSYINGIKYKPSKFYIIYAMYDKRQKKLDIYGEEDYKRFLDNDDYVKLINVSSMFLDLFGNIDVSVTGEDKILNGINTEFSFRISKLTEEI